MLRLLPNDLLPIKSVSRPGFPSAGASEVASGEGGTSGPAASSSGGMPVGGMESWDQSWGDSVTQRLGWRAVVAEDGMWGTEAWGTRSEVSEPCEHKEGHHQVAVAEKLGGATWCISRMVLERQKGL
jgi:hypothetical protein